MKLIDEIFNFSKKGIILDTKPLTLYIIGSLNPSRIKTLKRVKEFTLRDFQELSNFLVSFNEIYLTPYILGEFSHFTLEEKGLSEGEKKRIAHLILSLNRKSLVLEKLPVLKKVFSNKHIVVIGSNDASLLEIDVDKRIPILTSDGVLADIARKEGRFAFKFLPTLGIARY